MQNIDLLGPASAPGAVTTRPLEYREFTATDTWFTPCTSPSSRDGTQLQAAFLNALLAQLRYALRASGIDLDNVDDSMLWRAIKAALATSVHLGTVSGSPGALVVNDLATPISAYAARDVYALTFASGVNDGDSVAIRAVDGTLLPPLALQRNDGSAIQAVDIPIGAPALFSGFGSTALRLFGLARGEVPIIQINAPVIYVRPDGNDANDGSANTPAKAFRTITAAINAATRLYLAGRTLTILLGTPGTYEAPGILPTLGTSITVRGDLTAQGDFIISGAGPGFGNAIIGATGINLRLEGLTVRNTGSTNGTLSISNGRMDLRNVTVSTTVPGNTYGHFGVGGGGFVVFDTGCMASGSMGYLLGAVGGTILIALNVALVVGGTPAFSQATAFAQSGGSIIAAGGASVVGSATGQRYSADLNGTINTNGGGESFFPGDRSGSKSNGGQYV